MVLYYTISMIKIQWKGGIMKHPNGYGSVVKLSGKRRKPFAVRKTVGFNEKGYPIYKAIGYTRTRQEGLVLLAEYNKAPWNIDQQNITLIDLYKLYQDKRFIKLGNSTKSSLKTAFKHCIKYHNTKYKDLKAFHMQDCIDECGCGYATQNNIKNLFSHLDKFALELDIINKSYAPLTKTANVIIQHHKQPFTDNEIKLLWQNVSIPYMDSILILIYSGFRISELLELKIENIDLKIGTLKGGLKTEAGKNRIIPIHSKIITLIENRYDENNEFLFEDMNYQKYHKIWVEIMDLLNMNHTPHECRHTFRSKLDSAGANKTAIDLMLGHKSKDIGERVYTHKTIKELKQNIELLN